MNVLGDRRQFSKLVADRDVAGLEEFLTADRSVDATPSARIMDAVAGLSSSSAHDIHQTSHAAAHFDTSGVINVRNGSGFTAASRVLYSPGVKYHFILDVNVSAHTYTTAYVVAGSTQTTLGAKCKFSQRAIHRKIP